MRKQLRLTESEAKGASIARRAIKISYAKRASGNDNKWKIKWTNYQDDNRNIWTDYRENASNISATAGVSGGCEPRSEGIGDELENTASLDQDIGLTIKGKRRGEGRVKNEAARLEKNWAYLQIMSTILIEIP